jgi:hypothetical protein
MKKHYDFSRAKQGVLYRPAKSLRIPIYLDEDVERTLAGKNKKSNGHLSKLVNKMLRAQIGVSDLSK